MVIRKFKRRKSKKKPSYNPGSHPRRNWLEWVEATVWPEKVKKKENPDGECCDLLQRPLQKKEYIQLLWRACLGIINLFCRAILQEKWFFCSLILSFPFFFEILATFVLPAALLASRPKKLGDFIWWRNKAKWICQIYRILSNLFGWVTLFQISLIKDQRLLSTLYRHLGVVLKKKNRGNCFCRGAVLFLKMEEVASFPKFTIACLEEDQALLCFILWVFGIFLAKFLWPMSKLALSPIGAFSFFNKFPAELWFFFVGAFGARLIRGGWVIGVRIMKTGSFFKMYFSFSFDTHPWWYIYSKVAQTVELELSQNKFNSKGLGERWHNFNQFRNFFTVGFFYLRLSFAVGSNNASFVSWRWWELEFMGVFWLRFGKEYILINVFLN